VIRVLERIMGGPLPRATLDGFNYNVPAPPRSAIGGRGRGESSARPPRPAPTPTSYGRNRLGPRRRK
jgi:hypothetical protein